MTANGRNIREQVLSLVARKDYRPLNKIDIGHKLDLTASERVALRKILRELERAGEIARIRKNRYVLPAEADLVAGKLSIHPAGYGFLSPEKSGEPDVFIAAENIGTAMHGDRVVARVSRDTPSDRIKGRREGRVIRILERAHDTIVGTLQRSRNFYYVVPDDPRFVHDIYVHPEPDQQPGDMEPPAPRPHPRMEREGEQRPGESLAHHDRDDRDEREERDPRQRAVPAHQLRQRERTGTQLRAGHDGRRQPGRVRDLGRVELSGEEPFARMRAIST